jgi:hypothetical protein
MSGTSPACCASYGEIREGELKPSNPTDPRSLPELTRRATEFLKVWDETHADVSYHDAQMLAGFADSALKAAMAEEIEGMRKEAERWGESYQADALLELADALAAKYLSSVSGKVEGK